MIASERAQKDGAVTDSHVDPPGDPEKTSPSLLFRVQSDDREAWERFVHIYWPLINRWCRGWGLQDADAADVCQEVFRKVTEKIAQFRHDRSGDTLRGWLWKIARTTAVDLLRRKAQEPNAVGGTNLQARLSLLPADADASATKDESGDGEADRLFVFRRVVEIVLKPCKEETRLAFEKVVIEGRRPADVAGELGMSVNAVHLLTSRLLRKIRDEYSQIIEI
jgi:RNA polymerase sigma-70 factor (ECF subfamily)